MPCKDANYIYILFQLNRSSDVLVPITNILKGSGSHFIAFNGTLTSIPFQLSSLLLVLSSRFMAYRQVFPKLAYIPFAEPFVGQSLPNQR